MVSAQHGGGGAQGQSGAQAQARTAAGVDPIDAGRQGLPIGTAGAGGAIQAVVIL